MPPTLVVLALGKKKGRGAPLSKDPKRNTTWRIVKKKKIQCCVICHVIYFFFSRLCHGRLAHGAPRPFFFFFSYAPHHVVHGYGRSLARCTLIMYPRASVFAFFFIVSPCFACFATPFPLPTAPLSSPLAGRTHSMLLRRRLCQGRARGQAQTLPYVRIDACILCFILFFFFKIQDAQRRDAPTISICLFFFSIPFVFVFGSAPRSVCATAARAGTAGRPPRPHGRHGEGARAPARRRSTGWRCRIFRRYYRHRLPPPVPAHALHRAVVVAQGPLVRARGGCALTRRRDRDGRAEGAG